MAYLQDADRHALDAAPRASPGGRRVAAGQSANQSADRLRLAGLFVVLGCAILLAFLFPALAGPLLVAISLGVAAWAVRARSLQRRERREAAQEAALVEARERAEQASRAKSRFLAMVSHELRTPLNGILGMAHLLERTALSPEQESYVAAMRRSGTALFGLVEDLLDFSTIEAGRFELRPVETDLHHLLEDAVELMAARAHEKGIDIACHIAPAAGRRIVTDPDRLRQVVFNLVGNAIKFTAEGGVTLEVDEADGRLVLAVADTGPGLAPEDLDRIFREFEQAGTDPSRRMGGVGLGLAISARIVAAMGGTITVASRPGEGACFTCSLPAEGFDPDPFRDHQALASKSVLIVSGSDSTAAFMMRQIVDRGGTARHVAPGALTAADLDAPDLTDIVVDQRAADAVETLFASAPAHGTGYGAGHARRILLVRPVDRAALATLKERGYDAWLVAPVRAGSLSAVLTGALGAPLPSPDASGAGRLLLSDADLPSLDILVAEDNPVNALLMTNVLRHEGHSVALVEDGRALLSAAIDPATARWRHDLVVTDLSMPHMDGATAIGTLRAHQRAHDLPHLPIVVLSADGQQSTRDGLLSLGADHYLEKPVDPLNLLRLVQRLSA
jgi:signal transduction histidine kinase/CheY-like chemotaxis protein